MAALRSGKVSFGGGGDDAPAAGTPAAGTATASEAGVVDPSADPVAAKVAEVAAKLEQRRAEKAEREAAEKPQGDAQALPRLDPAVLATPQGREHLVEYCAATGTDPIALFTALNEIAEGQAEVDPVEARLAALEMKRQADEERAKAQTRTQAHAEARAAFLGGVDPTRHTLLSKLGEDEIMARGIAAAKALTKAGEEADAQTIADLCEHELRQFTSKLGVHDARQERAAGSAGPRTLSGSIGGETPDPPRLVLGPEGRRARAKAFLARMNSGS